MNKKFDDISRKVVLAVKTYPLVLLMSVIMASMIIYLIENSNSFFEFTGIKLIICSSLGISVLFAAKMLSQRVGKELLWQSTGLLILVGFYFILPSKEDDFDEVFAYVLVPTYILAHLFVSFAAYINKKSEYDFWEFNKNLFIISILTAIFTFVLTAGVNLALLAIENLFNWNFNEKIYGKTAAVIGIVGNTLIFLLFTSTGVKSLEQPTKYPVVLKFFTQFILIPLLLLYVVILYLYTGKIVLNWELPQGWVSYLVLAYSIVGILALLLVHPLRNEAARSWVAIFSKIFYFSLFPLLILLFTAIFTRILEYGYTEPRYYVLLLALWLTSVQLYFIFNKKATIKFIPMSLFVFGLFALLFPYFNSFAVANRSQKAQLEQLLTDNNLLSNGKIAFDEKVSAEVAESVADKFKFLSTRGNTSYLLAYLPDSLAQKERSSTKIYIRGYFNRIVHKVKKDNIYVVLNNVKSMRSIGDFDFLVYEDKIINSPLELGEAELLLTKKLVGLNHKYSLELSSGETADLLPKLKALVAKYDDSERVVDVDDLFIETEIGNYQIKIIYESINHDTSEKHENFHLQSPIYLIKKRD